MATYLDRIIAEHRVAAAADLRLLDELFETAVSMPGPRAFAAALADPAGLSIIAEVKRRSPSKGDLDPGLDPAALAEAYAAGGASCLSVLTDRDFFGGAPSDLAAARDASGLAVLRKDFTVCPADVCDARVMGADAVLLIVAALSPDELAELSELAASVGLAALVEVHDEAELERSLQAGAKIVGVNQRDLRTFEVDPQRAAKLRPLIPTGVLAVAESGIGSPDDARRLADAGYDAVLVGESLIRAPDRTAAVAALRLAGVSRCS